MGLKEPHDSQKVAEATDRVLDNELADDEPESDSGGFGARFPRLKGVGRLLLAWIIGSVLVAALVFAFGLSLAAFTPPAQMTMIIISTVITYFVLRNRTRF